MLLGGNGGTVAWLDRYMPFSATARRDEVRTRTAGSRRTQCAQKERRREAEMG
jgi:hypothetical protein